MTPFAHVLPRLLAGISIAMPVAAFPQAYPLKAIRVVSNSAAGSPGDIALRLVAPKMSAGLGKPVVVETKTGGGGQVAATDVLRAGPDGYALLFSSSQIAISKFLLKNVTFEMLRDFAPISLAVQVNNFVVVHGSVSVKSLGELIEYSKRNPGKISYSSNGIGSSIHLYGLAFMMNTGARMMHIPYSSSTNAMRMNDFFAGRVVLIFNAYNVVKAEVDSGKARVLAVVGERRYKRLPDVPAMTEAFPDYRFSNGFWGFFGPASLPQPILARLSEEIQREFADSELEAKLDAIDLSVVGSSAPEFLAYLKKYEATIESLVKAAGIKPE